MCLARHLRDRSDCIHVLCWLSLLGGVNWTGYDEVELYKAEYGSMCQNRNDEDMIGLSRTDKLDIDSLAECDCIEVSLTQFLCNTFHISRQRR